LLALIFFALIFTSFLWLFFSLSFVADSLSGISFFDAGIANIILYTLLVCLPIFLLWTVFGYINQYLQNQKMSGQLHKLWGQMKKNQDYSDLIARALIEAKQSMNDGFMLSRLDLLIADLNELLSEIINSGNLASTDKIDALWAKVQNGGKWSFGKIIIEASKSQHNFKERMVDLSLSNHVLAGSIMEFCARYNAILNLLENHDKDKLFLDIMETGIMGKTYSILASVSAEILKTRSVSTDLTASQTLTDNKKNENTDKLSPVSDKEPRSNTKFSFMEKMKIFNKKDDVGEISTPKDAFSIALERSFKEEPQISIPDSAENDLPQTPTIELPQPEETSTQKMLENLKKEWEDVSIKQQPLNTKEEISEDTDMVYPFGSWTDEQSYQK